MRRCPERLASDGAKLIEHVGQRTTSDILEIDVKIAILIVMSQEADNVWVPKLSANVELHLKVVLQFGLSSCVKDSLLDCEDLPGLQVLSFINAAIGAAANLLAAPPRHSGVRARCPLWQCALLRLELLHRDRCGRVRGGEANTALFGRGCGSCGRHGKCRRPGLAALLLTLKVLAIGRRLQGALFRGRRAWGRGDLLDRLAQGESLAALHVTRAQPALHRTRWWHRLLNIKL
mmetsp:Transcript_61376/g.142859  ORF Transcript_61376/g.142859 Transcript_61376/m.142859 type:complete len:233 (+) Transcript_61376:578-1276(+)